MNPITAAFRAWFPTMGAQRHRLHHDLLLHALEGRRGRGKSYVMTELTLDLLRHRRPIVTNTRSVDWYRLALILVREGNAATVTEVLDWVATNVKVATTWNDILEAYDCVVILDEATRLFDARKGMGVTVPSIVYEWFKQSRKVRVTTYLVTHSIEWLDPRLRQNLDLFWQVRKVLPKRPKAFAPDGSPVPTAIYLYGLDPGGVGRVDAVNRLVADWIAEYRFDVRVARSYHSWELLQEVGGEPKYSVMAEIAAFHAVQGRRMGLDGQELLERDRQRLGGAGDAAHAARRAPRPRLLPVPGSSA